MTLQEIIKTLQAIALTQPNVRTATDGDIYEVMNGDGSVKYGVFHITQNTHQSYNDRDVYGLNLFYVDRNEDDNANTLQVQSTGKNVIDNIIKTFVEEFDGDFPNITYTPFTQRFKDDTAGVFAAVSMEVYKEWECAEAFGDFITPQVIVRNQSKTIQVTKSGKYVVTPDDGFTGLDKVVVDAEVANTVQDVKSIEITDNGKYNVVADEPFLSVGKVDIDINIPLQDNKVVEFTDNGTFNVSVDDEYKGMKNVEVSVNVPLQDNKVVEFTDNGTFNVSVDDEYKGMKNVEVAINLPLQEDKTVVLNDNGNYNVTVDNGYVGMVDVDITVDLPIQEKKTLTVNDNGTYTVSSDDGYVGMKNAEITFKYSPKQPLPNGICLSGSTWTEFDMNDYDWSMVYDFADMFSNCLNATKITIAPIKPLTCNSMFRSLNHKGVELYGLENVDVSEVEDMSYAFSSFQGYKLDLTNWDTRNVKNLSYAFSYNNQLTELRMGGDVSNVTNVDSIFSSSNNSTTFYYNDKYDYSKILEKLPSSWTAIPMTITE